MRSSLNYPHVYKYPIIEVFAYRTERGETLEQIDLGNPTPTEEAEFNFNRFNVLWEEEVEEKGLQEANLFSILIKFVGRDQIFYCLLLIMGATLFQIMTPLVAKWLVQCIEGSASYSEGWQWTFVGLMFLLPAAAGTLQGPQLLQAQRLSQNLYAALTTAVFRKSMRLSPHARREASTGRIVTLMSNDAGTTMEQALVQSLPLFVCVPQLFAVLTLLALEIGWSLVAGLGVMIIASPFSIVVSFPLFFFTRRLYTL